MKEHRAGHGMMKTERLEPFPPKARKNLQVTGQEANDHKE